MLGLRSIRIGCSLRAAYAYSENECDVLLRELPKCHPAKGAVHGGDIER